MPPFRDIWCVDFEFTCPPGHRPAPICMVAIELHTRKRIALGPDELRARGRAPFDTGEHSCMVAYYASAELGCFLELGWPLPANVVDLYPEFRNLVNRADGMPPADGYGLLGALRHFDLDAMAAVEKADMRALAMRGGPYTDAEGRALLDYCAEDVEALVRLWPRMVSRVSLRHALVRGAYMGGVAQMERTGTPVDGELYRRLLARWDDIQDALIERVDRDYGVFEGRTFRLHLFERWTTEHGIEWPRLESGQLALCDDTFRQQAKSHPEVAQLRELRSALAQMRKGELAIGPDDRNRCLLSPFGSKTSRNQPGNSKFIFGKSVWLRSLIRPEPGTALAYIDYSQQEFAIAGALSKDAAMIAAYQSGDPYLAFARQAGAVPEDATRQSHKAEREQYKVCALGTLYGMREHALAAATGLSVAGARSLRRRHQQTYPRFWEWCGETVSAFAAGRNRYMPRTPLGWYLRPAPGGNVRETTVQNFPVQATGAEILRVAVLRVLEAGVSICAPVHDALLIEAPAGDIEHVVATTRRLMSQAASDVLGGQPIRTDAEVIREGERYTDPRGAVMWQRVAELLGDAEQRPRQLRLLEAQL